ncbi:MAG TPA: hypothetical protein DCY07_03145 [Rhodospirillaceae bacterium]|nr:hypothetical protein [Rhodospirillaceae bacterium]
MNSLHQRSFDVSDTIETDVHKAVKAALSDYAVSKNVPPYDEKELSIVRRSENGEVVACLTGRTYWNWLCIEYLWVHETLRGQGVGSALVKAAEDEAQMRGCVAVYLWSEHFFGPDFYPKLGYTAVLVVDDAPIGHQCTEFIKYLGGVR